MKSIPELIGDFKTWIALVALIAGILVGAITYINMPKKVEAIENTIKDQEKKISETDSSIQQLAGTVDKYVSLQAEQQKHQEEREKLMLELIKSVKEGK